MNKQTGSCKLAMNSQLELGEQLDCVERTGVVWHLAEG
jgi:hypothetical protein